MVFARHQKNELKIQFNNEIIDPQASRLHISTKLTVSDNPNATESLMESELTNIFENQSHLKQ